MSLRVSAYVQDKEKIWIHSESECEQRVESAGADPKLGDLSAARPNPR